MSVAFSMRALRRHIVLILVTIVVVTGAGVALGAYLPKTYSSHAQVLLGLDIKGSTIDPQTASLYLKDRAMTYAQLATADDVVNPVAAAAGIDPDVLRGQVVASIVPETVVLDLSVTGSTAEEAVALTHAVSDRFQVQVSALNVQTGGPAILPAQLSSPQPASAPDQLHGKTLVAVSALIGVVIAVLLALLVELVKTNRAASRNARPTETDLTPAPVKDPPPAGVYPEMGDFPQAVNGTDRRLRPPHLTVGPNNMSTTIGTPQRRDRAREQGSNQAIGRRPGSRSTHDR